MSCPDGIDPRMPRFGQALTGSLLVLGFVLQQPFLVLGVAAVLAGAALGGPRWSLWATLYRATLRPLIGPPGELEDPRGPRFAKQLGFVFTSIASASLLSGISVLAVVGWGLALLVAGLALLAATTGFCLACWLYPWMGRLRRPSPVEG